MNYEERVYRSLINKTNLISYQVRISESDLFISSDSDLSDKAFVSLEKHRHHLESYIRNKPEFKTTLLPMPKDSLAPPIVRDMMDKSAICGVGPMASVAGAVAQFVGQDLLELTDSLIIENGGDIYLKSRNTLTAAIFAGESTLSNKVHLIVKPEQTPLGICTSSATVGPSLSFGRADAVCVVAKTATLADAAASAVGNRAEGRGAIKKCLDFGMSIPGVIGIVIIVGNDIGAAGDIELG